jgi:hypothetical protein
MLESGKRVIMTKGYRGVGGVILEKTDSDYEFYIIKLDNGIHMVAGPTAFTADEPPETYENEKT